MSAEQTDLQSPFAPPSTPIESQSTPSWIIWNTIDPPRLTPGRVFLLGFMLGVALSWLSFAIGVVIGGMPFVYRVLKAMGIV